MLRWVSDNDPVKADTLQRMTLVEFYFWADEKIGDLKRQQQATRKRT